MLCHAAGCGTHSGSNSMLLWVGIVGVVAIAGSLAAALPGACSATRE
jgi:hypothetical protein